MPKTKWTTLDIPPQTGKIALVTGGTKGLGWETGLALAKAGATVIITGRSEERVKDKLALYPDAKIEFGKVDQSSLVSVAEYAKNFSSKYDHLDILMNNTGILGSGDIRNTPTEGFEMIFATNHLSHFALTAHLLPLLKKSSSPRVVNVSALSHKYGKINFEDLQTEKNYKDMSCAYNSKLANLLFTFELQRKSDERNWGLMCNAAHPGLAGTDGADEFVSKLPIVFGWLTKTIAVPHFSQSAADGALSTLFAATSTEAKPVNYYGPTGLMELSGPVGLATIDKKAKDKDVAARLWDVSVQLTAVSWS